MADKIEQAARLFQEGEQYAHAGNRPKARRLFRRVLGGAADPQLDIRALLWLAFLDPDPQQSMAYLDRVLDRSPGHPDALEGKRWAQKRIVLESQGHRFIWLDMTLVGSLFVVALLACAILFFFVVQAPRVVQAANRSTLTPRPTSTPTPVPTFTLMPTFTPWPVPTWTAAPLPTPTATFVVPGELPRYTHLGEKWIELDLSEQTLIAHEGQTLVFSATVSTGVNSMPTPKGEYTVISKVRSQVMSGPGYRLPNVEYVSYFYKGYAIHGTYWHDNFGQQMSHGCVNMTNDDAKWIFEWAPLGTLVRVHN